MFMRTNRPFSACPPSPPDRQLGVVAQDSADKSAPEDRKAKTIMPSIGRDWRRQIVILDGGSTNGSVQWRRARGYFVSVQKEPGLRFGSCFCPLLLASPLQAAGTTASTTTTPALMVKAP